MPEWVGEERIGNGAVVRRLWRRYCEVRRQVVLGLAGEADSARWGGRRSFRQEWSAGERESAAGLGPKSKSLVSGWWAMVGGKPEDLFRRHEEL